MELNDRDSGDLWSQLLRFNLVGFGVPVAALAIVMAYSYFSGMYFRDSDLKQLAGLLWLAGILALGGVFVRALLSRPRRRSHLHAARRSHIESPDGF